MSLEKKVVLLAGLLSLNACEDSNEQEEIIESIDGVNIKHGITDSEGKKTFLDDQIEGNTADLTIKNDFGNPIADVEILFADGYGFEMFLLVHPGYEPQLQIALHNSEHIYSLTPAPLQFIHHNKNGKEKSLFGAENAFNCTKNWQNKGCYNREELGTAMQPGAYLVKKGLSYVTMGASDIFIGDLAAHFKKQMGDDDIVEMRSFIPSKYGIYGLTSISALEIKEGSCDAFQEEVEIEEREEKPKDDYQCKDTIFCDHFNKSLDQWNYQGSTYLDNGWLKLDGANIINKNKIDFEQCNSVEIQYQANTKGNYGLFLGNEIALYANGANDSLQFVCGSDGEEIYVNMKDNHTVKVQLGNSLNVNGNFITCYNNPSQVNFSSGKSSFLGLDYVEVRCK